jgi:hypothetical protein
MSLYPGKIVLAAWAIVAVAAFVIAGMSNVA